MQQLELLWRLQEIDLGISKLEGSLEDSPLIREAERVQQVVEEQRSSLEKTKEELENKKKEIRKKEMELQDKSQESSSLRKQMYGGEISSTKELEQMEKKLKLLEKDKGELESRIIEEMEKVEEMEEEKKKLEEELKEEEKKLEKVNKELEEEQGKTKQELEEMRQKRRDLESGAESKFLEKYESFSRHYNGKGIARVDGDICEGCQVFISSAIKGRLYKQDKLVYCENCGRILVWLPGEEKEV